VIDTAAAAFGSLARCAVLPVTVRLTDVTADAVAGTVSCACSSRGADFASTAPRSQEEVPSSLPQPTLNLGVPARAGADRSRRTASGTFPPVVQALIVHWAACPRLLLAWAWATWIQRLTWAAGGVGLAPVGVGVGVAVLAGLVAAAALAVVVGAVAGWVVGFTVGVGVPARVRVATGVAGSVVLLVMVRVADGLLLGAALSVLVTVGVAFLVVRAGAGDLTMAFVAAGWEVSVRVGAGFAEWVGGAAVLLSPLVLLAVGVGVGVGSVDADADADADADVDADADADVDVDVDVDVDAAGVVGAGAGGALDVVGDGAGVLGVVVVDVGDGEVAGGEGLGDEAGSCSGSQDLLLALVAALAVVLLAVMARLVPEAAVSRTLPAISVTVAGRACAKRMKCPLPQCSSLLLRNDANFGLA